MILKLLLSKSRNMIGDVKRLSIFFFAHHKHQKKLEEAIQNTQPESNLLKLKDLCRARWINGSMLLIVSRNFTTPLLLVLRTFEMKALHVVSWLCARCQYSLAGNNKNRIHQCSWNYQWVSTVSRGPHNESSRGGLRHSSGCVWDQDFDIIPQASQRECWL